MPNPLNSGRSQPRQLDNVACPYCPLLCDDLSVEQRGDELRVVKNGCAQSVSNFARVQHKTGCSIDGSAVSHKRAVAEAARLLKRASAPLISGLGTDVEGMREAVALAEKTRGIIDHANSSGFDSGVRVLQSRGWYLTTLAELRNRADLVVVAGADVVNHYGNFLRRHVAPKQTLHPARRSRRRVVFLGPRALAPDSSKACAIETIACDRERIAEAVGALRACTGGRKLDQTRVAGVRIRELETLAAALRDAEYPVFVWAPGQFPAGTGDLAIGAITRLIDDLNRSGRAAGLALGGDNGGMSAANVCAWLTGYPLHISYAGKAIDYDPVRYRTARLVADQAIDTLLWIDAFGAAPAPSTGPGVKRIVIGLPDEHSPSDADVFIPVGTPGVDHAGRLVRTDAVVSIRVDQLRPRAATSVRKVLHDIAAQC